MPTDFRGVCAFRWRARGPLTTLTYPDGSTRQYQYDGAMNRTLWILGTGERVTLTFDGVNRMTALTPPPGQAGVAQTWDARSRRIALSDGSGTTQ